MRSTRPVLVRRARLRADPISGGYMLLLPERGLRLNASAAAILRLCDGEHSVEQIARGLAPPEQEDRVLTDVAELVRQLSRRGMLTVSDR
jgi:pyrroloquinoline quinone biosynthesis protein D